MTKAGVEESFMTSPSPGQIARYLKNHHYKTVEEYLFTLADVMAREYRAIVEAGFILQLDCPDLAMSYALYPGIGIADYRKIISHERRGAQSRGQGSAGRPHAHARLLGLDARPAPRRRPLKDIADILLNAKPQRVVSRRQPRHGHEWKVWRDVKLPDGKIIIPGVINSTSNFVEHPELVADRIVQYAHASAARTSSPASIAASAPSPAGSRSTPRSCG